MTAYCHGHTTASGAKIAPGMVAADPRVFPIGSQIALTGVPGRYARTYRVTDTGPAIRGHRLDLYVPSCQEARRFGRKTAQASVVARH